MKFQMDIPSSSSGLGETPRKEEKEEDGEEMDKGPTQRVLSGLAVVI